MRSSAPSRKGGNAPLFKAFQIDHFQRVFHFFLNFRLGELGALYFLPALFIHIGSFYLFEFQSEGHVVKYVEMGKQGVFLKDRIDGAAVGGEIADILAVEEYFSLRRHLEPRDHAQRGGFAAARRP